MTFDCDNQEQGYQYLLYLETAVAPPDGNHLVPVQRIVDLVRANRHRLWVRQAKKGDVVQPLPRIDIARMHDDLRHVDMPAVRASQLRLLSVVCGGGGHAEGYGDDPLGVNKDPCAPLLT